MERDHRTGVTIKIRVPASSANLGPGFDTLGLALSLYFDMHVTTPSPLRTARSSYPQLSISYASPAPEISLIPEHNLILQACIAVSKVSGKELPSMHVLCVNEIPFGSGLGSSGSAIVAGVFLANCVLELGLTKEQMLPFCLEFDGHPDVTTLSNGLTRKNVAPSLFGGYIAAYMINSSEACHASLPFNDRIRAIVATPAYTLPTTLSRSLLPPQYTRADLIFNLQRCALLTTAFIDPDPKVVYGAMQDRVHQQYRQSMIPGFEKVLKEVDFRYEGLLGVALSGAGPSVIALAVGGFDAIGEKMKELLSASGCEIVVRVLECDRHGARVFE